MSELRLCTALGAHMILQRETNVRLWGKGKREGDVVYAVFGPYETYGIVNNKLEWEAFLPPMPANTVPETLVISDGEDRVAYDDILVGDVWVINGQSNAEYCLDNCNYNRPDIYAEDIDSLTTEDNIRIVLQRRGHATMDPNKMLTPQFDLPCPEQSSWRDVATAENRGTASALAFFFARKVSRALKGRVPIGIVQVASSGSPMMELIMPELVSPLGYTKPEKEDIPLAGIYNALMAPIQKMTIKGMLFYQGESEQRAPHAYAYQLKWYVEELRKRFEIDFPFYQVQLASHNDMEVNKLWTRLFPVRCAQNNLMDILDNSYTVTAIDIGSRVGDKDMAHPPYKQPVGERLATAVLANEYGVGDPEFSLSPRPCHWRFDEDKITVHFDFVGDGLVVLKGEKLTGFEAMTQDGKYKKVRARIVDEETVEFRGVKNAKALRYACVPDATWEHANLGSSTELPTLAFEIFDK
ncbi:MAG: hypothetical protein IKB86_01245 [Clostridia bacterium]|nr:hypothetical protein [Clostridia bacterium]